MTKTDPFIQWVKENLARKGYSQKGLAAALNVDASAVSKVVSGKRQLKTFEVTAAAEYFGSEPPGIEVQQSTQRLTGVAIVGVAEAGAFREVDELDQSEPDVISLPSDTEFPSARQFAVTVSGDSMNALKPRPILSGDRAVCVAYEDIERQISLRDGMTVLLERTRDGGHTREWSIKQMELYEGRTEFHPRSDNSRHKPIVVHHNVDADDGVKVEIIGLVRRIVNDVPL